MLVSLLLSQLTRWYGGGHNNLDIWYLYIVGRNEFIFDDQDGLYNY